MGRLPQEIIRRKRDGETLSEGEIAEWVAGIGDGTLTDAQIAAFAMAVFFRGMTLSEQIALTRAMQHSGATLAWRQPPLDGPVVDKHSTGGVGDKVSLVLAPLVAACGGYVPMISGRGLGHTGGTLDKLAAIPGYDPFPEPARFQRVVREVGCAIIGQTDTLAPADRRFYAVRDVTATVESVPLITASILAKKLAEGLDALLLDVKAGNGAFASDLPAAQRLAESLVEVADGAGVHTTAMVTDMNQVLGWSVGNALEVAEAIDYLSGAQRETRFHRLVLEQAGELLRLGGLAKDQPGGRAMAERALDSGRAQERLGRMLSALGAPRTLLERPWDHLPQAPVVRPVPAGRDGWVTALDTRAIGLAVVGLGGGRRRRDARIDPRVGLSACCQIGQGLVADQPLAWVHAASETDAAEATARVQAAIGIGDRLPPPSDVLLETLTALGDGAHTS